jgi:hypothetical protein
MTPETWAEIDHIVANALELPEGKRAAYLDEACARNAALRNEAESLLRMSSGAACLFPSDTAAEPFGGAAESASLLGRRRRLCADGGDRARRDGRRLPGGACRR